MGKLKRDFALGYVLGMNNAPTPEPEPSTDEWTPDEGWLDCPPAESGEITAVVNDVATMQFYLSSNDNYSSSVTVDWGDGIIETFTSDEIYAVRHTYTTGSGHIVENGTSQFIMRIYNISSNAYIRNFYNDNYGGVLLASVNVNAIMSNMSFLFSGSYELCRIDVLSGTVIPSYFCNVCYSLKIANLVNTITSINTYAFYYCISLIKINMPTSLLTIEANALESCRSITIFDFSNTLLITILEGGCSYCTSLRKVILPTTILEIKQYGFDSDYSLSYINPPAGCIIGTNAFRYCYSLHPIPV